MNKRFAEEGCHLRAGPGPNPEKSGRMTNLWGPRPVPTSPGRLLLRGRMVDVKKQNKMTGKPMKLVNVSDFLSYISCPVSDQT